MQEILAMLMALTAPEPDSGYFGALVAGGSGAPVEVATCHSPLPMGESDIPTVSIGSGWDVQTAASWAEEATRGLSNAQHFFIAEAGHGALAYVDCVGDMTAAFINDPSRQLDDSCEKATAVKEFYIAPWVGEEEEPGE